MLLKVSRIKETWYSIAWDHSDLSLEFLVLNWEKKLQSLYNLINLFFWAIIDVAVLLRWWKKIWQVLASLSFAGHTWPCPTRQNPWQVISPHFPQKVWPSKHISICKRTKIHLVRSPKSGGIGPWEKASMAHFSEYFNPSTTCFTLPSYDADHKAKQKVMKLTKMFRGKWQSGPHEKEVVWP